MSKWLKGLALFLLCGVCSATTCYLSGGAMLMIGGFVVCVQPSTPPSCPQTNGVLTTAPVSPRVSGVSPLLVFFDNSAVATSNKLANSTAFQDVYSSWDFGDTLGSDTGTWRYDSNPNHNVRNLGIGNETAHLYVTEGSDKTYTAVVTSNDGTLSVGCSMTITVTDPSTAFPTTATTCISTWDFYRMPCGRYSDDRLHLRCGEWQLVE